MTYPSSDGLPFTDTVDFGCRERGVGALGLLGLLMSLALMFMFASKAGAAPAPVMRAMDAQVGVVVHVNGYGNVAKTVSSLQGLGIQRVRLDSPQPVTLGAGNLYDALCAAGIRITPFMNGWIDVANDTSPHAEFAATKALEQRHPGCIEAIEGPNEVNNFPQNYAGHSDPRGWNMSSANRMAAQAFQSALYKRVKADPVLRSKPVIGYTDIHPANQDEDVSDDHDYEGSWWADPAFQKSAAMMQAANPGKPMASTEWGYPTVAGVVDLPTQALRITAGVASALQNHINPAFIYELKDEGASQTDKEQNYGLLDKFWIPKPAAVRLQRLLSILKDTGPANFTAIPLTASVDDPAMHTLLVSKSDGSYLLFLWNSSATPNQKRQLTITLSKPMAAGIFHLTDGSTSALTRTASLTLPYDDIKSGLQIATLR